mmetsp:Transcript_57429/g.145812  ORF Transcript_57429/g.145812 Transcript_57429/m.145812 type:complete len:213 (+) Transcript_57429:54-692(+)
MPDPPACTSAAKLPLHTAVLHGGCVLHLRLLLTAPFGNIGMLEQLGLHVAALPRLVVAMQEVTERAITLCTILVRFLEILQLLEAQRLHLVFALEAVVGVLPIEKAGHRNSRADPRICPLEKHAPHQEDVNEHRQLDTLQLCGPEEAAHVTLQCLCVHDQIAVHTTAQAEVHHTEDGNQRRQGAEHQWDDEQQAKASASRTHAIVGLGFRLC